MSLEKLRDVIREEVETVVNKHVESISDIEVMKSQIAKDLTAFIARTTKFQELITTDPGKSVYQITVAGKKLNKITVLNQAGVKKMIDGLERRINKRLKDLEDQQTP